jgi:hypothetical protein
MSYLDFLDFICKVKDKKIRHKRWTDKHRYVVPTGNLSWISDTFDAAESNGVIHRYTLGEGFKEWEFLANETKKACTCGAKHTSMPDQHSAWCDGNPEDSVKKEEVEQDARIIFNG